MGRGQTQDFLLESGICFQRWQVAAVRPRCNSVPCLSQVHCGEPSVAFKVTAAGIEFEQISHWILSIISCSICCKNVKSTFLRRIHRT